MKIGYARVSTDEQNLDLQKDALRRAGCKVVFCDQGVSGTTFHRPGLERALRRLKNGGVLVVWRLDRLGRSLGKLVDLVAYLEQQRGMDKVSANSYHKPCSYELRLAYYYFAQ